MPFLDTPPFYKFVIHGGPLVKMILTSKMSLPLVRAQEVELLQPAEEPRAEAERAQPAQPLHRPRHAGHAALRRQEPRLRGQSKVKGDLSQTFYLDHLNLTNYPCSEIFPLRGALPGRKLSERLRNAVLLAPSQVK